MTVERPTPTLRKADAHLQNGRITRIDVDADGDGKTERWEYYDSNRRLSRIGISRSNDGTADLWIVPDETGEAVSRVETSLSDGRITRTEFHEGGELSRAEEDTDLDGRVDKWEEYVAGALVRVAFDRTGTGRPSTVIDYRQPPPR